ncbi:ABC transporter permease subunit [Actinocorallia sp. API 0066]|uniref:ABC transporter permease subunit n=1 Tax=Actinocorallia sp. API 0066 TaxID=2896846 RepID=UPI001E6029C1|nr:ABC transporter permease subunit [Actinocorallia sp. API 0066]MCD0451693.1 ABC transporter permease subunit [Actinocorallia sp. API 0066]
MIWLAWRQFRLPAAVAAGLLAALAAALAVTGPGIADAWTSGRAACAARGGDCATFAQEFFADHRGGYLTLVVLVLAVPGLIGLFWGAPLVARELEAGTHRLVWNQSVTRTRWLAVKLALVGAAAMAAAGLASLAVGWWSRPVDAAGAADLPRMDPVLFDARGLVPVAFAAFACALGVVAGMVARRTLAAMAVTLAGFALVQLAMPLLVRPHLLPPVVETVTVTRENLASFYAEGPDSPVRLDVKGPSGAWILANETVDAAGRVVPTVPLYLTSGPCSEGDAGGPTAECVGRVGELGFRQRLTYHPAERFWPLQWAEAGVYAALTAGLAGFAFWWLRRRVS